VGTVAQLPRTPKTLAPPAAAERPREGDVLFQHRVHHGHGGDGGIDVCGSAPLVPLTLQPPGSAGPAPTNPALVRTLAAPLEFKPQRPPSFLALLPTEARRGHPGARSEADLRRPEHGQGSVRGRHLN
jgi:hypothetical protein